MHTNQALRAYGCAECTFLTCQGFERYCGGFPEKRKPKRFWKTDPQWKAPKWCPRRKTPAVYRVYHYKNDGSMLLSNALLHFDGKGHGATAFVSDRHYALVAEGTTQLSARQFLTSSHQQPASTLLDYPDLVYGNVVEIDDGLRPCCFYYRSHRISLSALNSIRVNRNRREKRARHEQTACICFGTWAGVGAI